MELIPGSTKISLVGRQATNLRCSCTTPHEMQNEKHQSHDEQDVRSHEMPEILATREQSKPTRLIQAHLYLLLYRAGESNEFMSRRELKSAERRIPTLK